LTPVTEVKIGYNGGKDETLDAWISRGVIRGRERPFSPGRHGNRRELDTSEMPRSWLRKSWRVSYIGTRGAGQALGDCDPRRSCAGGREQGINSCNEKEKGVAGSTKGVSTVP